MESGRRSVGERRRDDVGAQDHARPPAVGVVVDRPVPAEAPLGAGRGRGRSARPRSRIRPGMLSPSGPSTIAGNSVRTSTSSGIRRRVAGAAPAEPGARGSRAGPALRRLRSALGLRTASCGRRSRGPDVVVVVDGTRVEVERVEVHDQLAALRREVGDDPRDARARRSRRAARGRRTPRRRRRGRCRRPAERPRRSSTRTSRPSSSWKNQRPGSRGSSGASISR